MSNVSGYQVNRFVNTAAVPNFQVQMMTNEDKGSLVSWEADMPEYCQTGKLFPSTCNSQTPTNSTWGLALTQGGGVSAMQDNGLPGQSNLFVPVLQTQNGSFVGSPGWGILATDQSLHVLWSVPNDYPQIATADGGVIGYSGITYDANGNATGQLGNLPIQSWPGYAYEIGSVAQVDSPIIAATNVFWPFTNFWPIANANDSGNSTAKTLPLPDTNHNHTLTIRDVKGQGINRFNHITAQVDNNQEVGFGPVNNLTPMQMIENLPVPGHIEPRAARVATLDAVTIYLTADEAAHAQAVIYDRSCNPGNCNPGYYQLIGRSCVDFGEDVVNATGFPAPEETFPNSLPKAIRAEQIRENTTQAP